MKKPHSKVYCDSHYNYLEQHGPAPIQTRTSISRKEFRIHSEEEWGLLLRKHEIRAIFGGLQAKFFSQGLELGCGSGQNSRHLAYYCKHLTATEYDAAKITACETEQISLAVADAQNLSEYATDSMDLIFSSNMIEHLHRVDDCLGECSRIIKTGGIVVHTVPTRTWKVFHLLMFYPVIVRAMLLRLKNAGQRRKTTPVADCNTLDDNLRPRQPSSLLGSYFPKIHGISKTHLQEFVAWGEKKWLAVFDRNELNVLRIVHLPFYYGHGYKFSFLLKWGNLAGLSSSTAYVLQPRTKLGG